jgi:hypothetical protein
MKLVRKKGDDLWRQWDPKHDDCMDRGVETMDVEPVEAGDGSNLPGIPAGYEAVRFGYAEYSDEYIDANGWLSRWDGRSHSFHQYIIIRKVPRKIRTVKVAKFATWWQDTPDSVRVDVMSQSNVDQLVEAKKVRRIGEWREIEIWEEDE